MNLKILILLLTLSSNVFGNAVNKKDYTFTIAKGKTVKENKQTFYVIPTTLTNKTKDTLKYLSMSCSWQEFYSINSEKMQIVNSSCDKNISILLTLAPNQSTKVKVKLYRPKSFASAIKFRLGFKLFKVSNTVRKLNFPSSVKQKNKIVIWSDTISI